MEYLRLFRQRTAEFRALGGEALVGGKRAETGGEWGREGAPLNPLLVPYIDLNIAPLRRIYAWRAHSAAAAAVAAPPHRTLRRRHTAAQDPPPSPPLPAPELRSAPFLSSLRFSAPAPLRFRRAVPTEAALAAVKAAAAGGKGVVEVGAGTGYWAALLRRRGVDVAAYDWTPLGSTRSTGSSSSSSSRSSGSDGTSSWVNGHHALPMASACQMVNVPPFTHVAEGDASVSAQHPDRSLLLCWPPPEETEAPGISAAEGGAAQRAAAQGGAAGRLPIDGGVAAGGAAVGAAGGDSASAAEVPSLAADALLHYRGSTLVFIGEFPLHFLQAHTLQSSDPSLQSHSSQLPSYQPQTAGPRFLSLLEKEWVLAEHVALPNWPGTHDCLTVWRRKGSFSSDGALARDNSKCDSSGGDAKLHCSCEGSDRSGRITEDNKESSHFPGASDRADLIKCQRQHWDDVVMGRLFLSPSIACGGSATDAEIVQAMEMEAVRVASVAATVTASALPHRLTATAKPSSAAHSSQADPRAAAASLAVRMDSQGVRLRGRLGSSFGGASVLERPGLDQSGGEDGAPKTDAGGEMGQLKQRMRNGGGDRYRVLLLDHEKHTEDRVAKVLPTVVPSVTADDARRVFNESRELGQGLVCVAIKEHAEFYAQHMAMKGLRSTIQPDGLVI
ncbi:unnamed protein product [Closterium sp. NIES-54]